MQRSLSLSLCTVHLHQGEAELFLRWSLYDVLAQHGLRSGEQAAETVVTKKRSRKESAGDVGGDGDGTGSLGGSKCSGGGSSAGGSRRTRGRVASRGLVRGGRGFSFGAVDIRDAEGGIADCRRRLTMRRFHRRRKSGRGPWEISSRARAYSQEVLSKFRIL
jgi:hypothetical protein